jgi:acyl carrier protein
MITAHDGLRAYAEARAEMNLRVKKLLVNALGLEIRPELIADDQPLFGGGLGLDSLDTLEIVVMMEEQFGVTLSDDDRGALSSVSQLVDFTIASLGGIPVDHPREAGADEYP